VERSLDHPSGELNPHICQPDSLPASLMPADIIRADIRPADIRPADIIPADIRPADITPADVIPAGIIPADIISANIIHTDIISTNVIPADIISAKYHMGPWHSNNQGSFCKWTSYSPFSVTRVQYTVEVCLCAYRALYIALNRAPHPTPHLLNINEKIPNIVKNQSKRLQRYTAYSKTKRPERRAPNR
jgi:hypothetical protein